MGGLGSPLKLSDRTLPLGVLQEGYNILLIGQFHCKKPHASRGCAKIIPCQAAQGQAWPKTCKTLAAGGQEGMVWLARVSRRFRVGGEVIGCRGFASQA